MDSTARADFTNVTIVRKPFFFDESAGFKMNGKPAVVLQFTGMTVMNKHKDYHTFRIWGPKAQIAVGRLKTGVVVRCKTIPQSTKMVVYGKGHKPLLTCTREVRKTWKSIFHIYQLDVVS